MANVLRKAEPVETVVPPPDREWWLEEDHGRIRLVCSKGREPTNWIVCSIEQDGTLRRTRAICHDGASPPLKLDGDRIMETDP